MKDSDDMEEGTKIMHPRDYFIAILHDLNLVI